PSLALHSFPTRRSSDLFPASREVFEVETPTTTGVFLGDIVISAEQAQRQAKSNRLSLEREIKQLILHGLLHLCGYDHERDKGEIDRKSTRLNSSHLGIS